MTGSRPADGSLENGELYTITLSFSERVDRASVLEHLRSDPPWLLRSARWQADTLLALRYWESFPPDTTIAVFLSPGWQDRHRVQQPLWQMVHFATGDSLLPGWLAGTVTFKGNPSRAMHLELADSLGQVERRQRPDRQGGFIFRHLPVDGRAWRLMAWQDADGDSLYDPAVDFADSLADSLLALTAAEPRRLELLLDVIDPDEPGTVTGNFACLDTLPAFYRLQLLPDSLRLMSDSLRLASDSLRLMSDSLCLAGDSLPDSDPFLLPDSLRVMMCSPRDEFGVWLRGDGDFSLDGVPPGPWWLFVHKDLVADSIWDPFAEPAYLDPGPRWLEPGGKLSWPRFRFAEREDSTGTKVQSEADEGATQQKGKEQ